MELKPQLTHQLRGLRMSGVLETLEARQRQAIDGQWSYLEFLSRLMRFTPLFLATALLAIIGTAVIVFRDIHQSDFRTGFILVQVSNLCFALGQILYRKVMQEQRRSQDSQVFGLLYLGALFVTFPSALYSTHWCIPALDSSQVITLLYLGLLPSGICFFLWNLGTRKTNAGFLAVANNLKVPLAVACSMIIFHEFRSCKFSSFS